MATFHYFFWLQDLLWFHIHFGRASLRSVGKESACNAGDSGSIPGSGRSTGEGIRYPFQYSWASLVTQQVKNQPAMWESWFQSLVGKIPGRRERLPTPIFWHGEFHVLYSPWGYKESYTTEQLSLSLHFHESLEKK